MHDHGRRFQLVVGALSGSSQLVAQAFQPAVTEMPHVHQAHFMKLASLPRRGSIN